MIYDTHLLRKLMMHGAELLPIGGVLGHKTINMTQRHAHLSPSYQREAMNLLKILAGHKMVTRPFFDLAHDTVTRYPSTMPE
jgi:hypothetical protein